MTATRLGPALFLLASTAVAGHGLAGHGVAGYATPQIPALEPALLASVMESRLTYYRVAREGSTTLYYGSKDPLRVNIVAAVADEDGGLVIYKGDPSFRSNAVAAGVRRGNAIAFTNGDPAFSTNIIAGVEQRADGVAYYRGDPSFSFNAVLSITTDGDGVLFRAGDPSFGTPITEREFQYHYVALVDRVLAPIVARFPVRVPVPVPEALAPPAAVEPYPVQYVVPARVRSGFIILPTVSFEMDTFGTRGFELRSRDCAGSFLEVRRGVPLISGPGVVTGGSGAHHGTKAGSTGRKH